ncbi:MAG: DUF3185 family protein [Bacteroidales bacterium]
MKIFITLLGIALIAGGAYLVYDGYQVKQTTSARIEKEVSTAIKYITDDAVKPKTELNKESDYKMVGGATAVVAGLVLVVVGLRRKGGRK